MRILWSQGFEYTDKFSGPQYVSRFSSFPYKLVFASKCTWRLFCIANFAKIASNHLKEFGPVTWSWAEYQEDVLLSNVTELITDFEYKMEMLELSVGSAQNSTTESPEAASA